MKKFFLLCVLCFAGLVQGAENKQPVLELLGELREAYNKVNSFTVEMQLERFAPDYALQNQKVWFKRPKYIKLKQLGPFKEDAELAIKPDGSIRGHLGGFLSFAVVSLDPDDENLYGVTHDTAFNTDFDRIIDIAFDLADRMTDFEIHHQGANIILDTRYAEEVDHYRLIIDAKTMMIKGLERYKKQQLLHRILWRQLNLNPTISDKEFEL